MHYHSIMGYILGGYKGDTGKEHGNYYNGFIYTVYIGIYGDNGKENGNYYSVRAHAALQEESVEP